MEQSPKQQAVELIKSSQQILIVSHKNPDGDALGSICALKIALEKIGKKVDTAVPNDPSSIFSFLPCFDQVKTEIDVSKDLIINLKLGNATFEKIGYKRKPEENSVDIIVTPGEGTFKEEDVKVNADNKNYDLVVILDTPNMERLGDLAQPADIFYEVPTINIDHHPANEKFGKVNWVELVATSTSEMLVSLLEALGKEKNLLDEDVATSLLTGLIYDTSSFQNINTTPKSLTIAAQLVAAGGRQQEIIRNLYKTKSLETLKLWGTILNKISEDKIHGFLWSSVTKREIDQSGAGESALSQIVDELLKSASDVDFALLLSERDSQVHGSLRAISKNFDVSKIAELFGGGGHEGAAAFRVEGNLDNKEDEILQKIRGYQSGHSVSKPNEPQSQVQGNMNKEESNKESQVSAPTFDRVKDSNQPEENRLEGKKNSSDNLSNNSFQKNDPISQTAPIENKQEDDEAVDLKEEFKEEVETKW